jgi:hypothetical protein
MDSHSCFLLSYWSQHLQAVANSSCDGRMNADASSLCCPLQVSRRQPVHRHPARFLDWSEEALLSVSSPCQCRIVLFVCAWTSAARQHSYRCCCLLRTAAAHCCRCSCHRRRDPPAVAAVFLYLQHCTAFRASHRPLSRSPSSTLSSRTPHHAPTLLLLPWS